MIGYALLVVVLIGIMLRGGNVLARLMLPIALVPPFIEFGVRYLGWPALTPSVKISFLLALAAWLVAQNGRPVQLVAPPSGRWVAAYTFLVTVSVSWGILGAGAADPLELLRQFFEWLLPPIAFFAIASTPLSEDELTAATTGVAWCSIVVALIAAMQGLAIGGITPHLPEFVLDSVAVGRTVLWFGSFRVYGTLPNLGPNFFGAALVFPTLFFLSRTLGVASKHRIFWGVGFLLLIAVVVATYSRGALLGVSVGTVTLLLLTRRYRTLALFATSAALLTIAFSQIPAIANALAIVSSGQLDTDSQARINIWRAIITQAPAHPFGLGFGGWPLQSMHSMFVGDPAIPVGGAHASENMWLRELAERGLLGVASLLGMMASLFLQSARGYRRASSPLRADWLATASSGTMGAAFAMLTGDHLIFASVAAVLFYFEAVAQSVLAEQRLAGEPSHELAASGAAKQ